MARRLVMSEATSTLRLTEARGATRTSPCTEAIEVLGKVIWEKMELEARISSVLWYESRFRFVSRIFKLSNGLWAVNKKAVETQVRRVLRTRGFSPAGNRHIPLITLTLR